MYVDKCPSIPRRVIIIAVIHPHENYTDVTSMCDYSKTIGKLHVHVSIYEEEKKEEKRIGSIATILNVLATMVNNINALFTS